MVSLYDRLADESKGFIPFRATSHSSQQSFLATLKWKQTNIWA